MRVFNIKIEWKFLFSIFCFKCVHFDFMVFGKCKGYLNVLIYLIKKIETSWLLILSRIYLTYYFYYNIFSNWVIKYTEIYF